MPQPDPSFARPPGAHIVAGGRMFPDAQLAHNSFLNRPDGLGFEVWMDSLGGVSWVEIETSPTTPPFLLDVTEVGLIHGSVVEHVELTSENVGIGIRDGNLMVSLRQDWSLLALGLLALTLTTIVGLMIVTSRSRRLAASTLAFARREEASREAERTRVAREIHDGPLQDLALLARSAAPEAQARLREVGDELRALATDLRPPALDRLGLASALDDLADRWASAPAPLSVRIEADTRGRLPPPVELSLYRVVQEALANASTHGAARTAWVFLHEAPAERRGALDVVVRDDGRGIPAEFASGGRRGRSALADGHFGLAGMAERARTLGGTLAVRRGPGGLGTEVRLHVPASALTGARPARAQP